MSRLALGQLGMILALLGALACTRKAGGIDGEGSESDDDSGTADTQSTTESSGESGSETTETGETGEPEPVDLCPGTPAIEHVDAKLDDYGSNIDYPEDASWDESCTVTAIEGDLVGGQSITLACVDAQGQAIEHVIEVQAKLVDATHPTTIPVTVGEQLQFTMWSRVWFAGGVSWVLRAGDELRLAYYSTIELPSLDSSFSPDPEFLAPIGLTLHDDICETVCPEPDPDDGGVFVPDDSQCYCVREQALEFVVGSESAQIQHDTAAEIGSSLYGFVAHAATYPNASECADFSGAWYRFLVISR